MRAGLVSYRTECIGNKSHGIGIVALPSRRACAAATKHRHGVSAALALLDYKQRTYQRRLAAERGKGGWLISLDVENGNGSCRLLATLDGCIEMLAMGSGTLLLQHR